MLFEKAILSQENICVLWKYHLKYPVSLKTSQPLHSLTNSYRSKHPDTQICENAEWVDMLFKRPDFLNKVYEVPQYSVGKS